MKRYFLICVAMLAVVGISSCGGGVGKGRNAVMEGIALASTLKLEIQDFHSSVKEFPKDEKNMNFPSLSNKLCKQGGCFYRRKYGGNHCNI